MPVAGGAFDYDADGELTGVFRENACNAFTAIKAEQTVEMVERTLRTAMAHAAECGVTSVQTMDVRPSDWPIMLEAYKRVQQDPTVRVYHQCNFQDPESFQRFLDAGYKTGVGDAVNKIGAAEAVCGRQPGRAHRPDAGALPGRPHYQRHCHPHPAGV